MCMFVLFVYYDKYLNSSLEGNRRTLNVSHDPSSPFGCDGHPILHIAFYMYVRTSLDFAAFIDTTWKRRRKSCFSNVQDCL